MSLFNEIPDRSISRSPTASKLYSRPVASSSVKSELVERPPPHSLHKKKVTAAQLFAVTRAFHAKLAVQHATHIADLKRDNDSVYRSPRLEEAARMMDWKAALYPNERVYSTRKAAYRPGNGRRTALDISSDDSDTDTATDRDHTPDPILLGTPSARDRLRWSSQVSSQHTERRSSFATQPTNLSVDFERERPALGRLPMSPIELDQTPTPLSGSFPPQELPPLHFQAAQDHNDPLDLLSSAHWSPPRQPVDAQVSKSGGSQFKFRSVNAPYSFAAAQRSSQSRRESRGYRSYASLSTVEEKMDRWTKCVNNFALAVNQGKNVLVPARLNPIKDMLSDMEVQKASIPAGNELQVLLVALRSLEDVDDDRTELDKLKAGARRLRLYFSAPASDHTTDTSSSTL